MRRAVVSGPQSLSVVDRPKPTPEAGEIRVRIEACGICGSDLHAYRMGSMGEGHTPGHEISGVVDAIGPDVLNLKAGDRVAIEPLLSCGECTLCQEGRYALCSQSRILGVQLAGGLADYIVVPEFRAHKLASDLDPAVAAMTEPVAVAVHALTQGCFKKESRVLVLGSGTVGLVSILVAHCLGAKEVWASARHSHQAEMALRMGASRVLNESEATPSSLASLGASQAVDLAIETVGGHANTLNAACQAVRPGGHISVLGLFQEEISLPGLPLVLKEITMSGSNCYGNPKGGLSDFQRAGEIVDAERERLAAFVTHRMDLTQVDQAFKVAADKTRGAIKVMVQPGHSSA
ncbi:MAG: hypothetical protein CL917_03800 [Deltaproteobacteria bacterium]|nr:hypothetical protein [Deltaproteobacteria bacterium]